MVGLKKNDITLGEPNGTTGHTTYRNALLKENGKKIIIKENKFNNPSYSRLEVSFSQVAQFFLNPYLTPKQGLVYEDNGVDVFGVFSEHLCYTIAQKEGEQKTFYTLTKPQRDEKESSETTPKTHLAGYVLEKQIITNSEQIHAYFLDNLPQGFITGLINSSEISIDYDSLASLLATSYTLEEDDLHKGNFGFYLVERNGKPHAVFFKIDHDLMFVDSIMAFHTRRQFHWLHGPGAFNIHTDDLRFFPNIKAAHAYWPTKFGYISHPFHAKEYHNFSENRAFSDLFKNPDFIKAKWNAFYRHILISTVLIEYKLMECTDINDPVQRAHIALVTNAMVSRVVHLRAALLSIPEFRKFVCELTADENKTLIDQLVSELNVPADKEGKQIDKSVIRAELESIAGRYPIMCHSCTFEEGDTPLHTAIKTGEYRYDETFRNYGQFINTPNKYGKTPLDSALECFSEDNKGSENISTDTKAIIKHLLEKGANKTEAYKKYPDIEFMAYKLLNPYLSFITPEITYSELKKHLRDIGEAHHCSLKTKKLFAIECIQQWMKQRASDVGSGVFKAELDALKKDINGTSSKAETAPLLYIRQLRSQYWIIRQIRGLYGMTTTQNTINDLITVARNKLNSEFPTRNSCSFFSCCMNFADKGKREILLLPQPA